MKKFYFIIYGTAIIVGLVLILIFERGNVLLSLLVLTVSLPSILLREDSKLFNAINKLLNIPKEMDNKIQEIKNLTGGVRDQLILIHKDNGEIEKIIKEITNPGGVRDQLILIQKELTKKFGDIMTYYVDHIFPLGTRLKARDNNEYELLEIIGRGACGITYKGRAINDSSTVAIKIISPVKFNVDKEDCNRFIQEAIVIGSLRHANIVRGYGYNDTGYTIYSIMEFIDGSSVEDKIKNGPLNEDEAVKIIIQIVWAIQELTKYEIIHRDIKPANIIVSTNGIAKFSTWKRNDSILSL